MGKRLGLLLTAILFSVMSVNAVSAQTEINVLVYDHNSGIITHVTEDNIIHDTPPQTFQLPMPEGYTRYSYQAFASIENQYIAYRVSNEDESRNQFIVVRYGDVPEVILAYTLDIPVKDYLSTVTERSQVFNEANQVVYAYASLEDGWQVGAWRILIFDLQSGEIAYQLDPDGFIGNQEDTVNVPVPYVLSQNQVTFTLYPFMNHLGTHHPVYTWDFQTGETTSLPYDLSLVHDRYESAIVDFGRNGTLPDNPAFVDIVRDQKNALQLFIDGESFNFYQDNGLSFDRAYFIRGADFVMASAITPEDTAGKWMIFNPYGFHVMNIPVTEDGSPFRAQSIYGDQAGFIYTLDNALYLMSFDPATETATANYLADARGRIIGLQEVGGGTSSQIVALYSDSIIRFAVGDTVYITEAGNQVRMRATPGGEVLRQFNAGAQVTIVGGPENTGGVRWWQMQDENGLIGWVAEGLENDLFIDRLP